MKSSVFITAALLVACSAHQQNQAQQSIKSGYLVTAVGAKLAAVDVDAPTTVQIAANGNTITLTGQAHTPQEREQYAAAARSVPGVAAVANELRVNPRLRSTRANVGDAALEARVTAAIAGQAGINVFHITPSARNGIVTLSGRVPSPSTKQTILESVRRIGGVRGIVDRIAISP